MKNLLLVTSLCLCNFVFAQNTDSTEFYFQKGMAEKTAGRFLVASQQFDKALNFNPKHQPSLLQNAYSCLEMKRTDQAKALLIKLYEFYPNFQEAKQDLMQIYFNYRQFSEAIALANTCNNCKGSARILGMSHYEKEDYPEAEKHLLTALKQDPSDAVATHTLARVYVDMELYKKAIPWYEKAVALKDAKSSWMYEQGILLYNQSQYKAAMQAMQNAADHGYTQSHDFNENLGFASLYSGEYEKGESLLMTVLEKKPGNKDLIRGLAEVLFQQKQFDKSLQYCQKLLELDGNDGKALYQAGLCFQRKGEKDRGQQMCDKAIIIDPSLASLRTKKEITGL